MARQPNPGESTKIQKCYGGPLQITEVFPKDAFRMADIWEHKKRLFATTVHIVLDFKSWKLIQADEGLNEEVSDPMDNVQVEQTEPTNLCDQRNRRPPIYLQDYEI